MGSIGVGISTPQQKLHVNGNTFLDGAVGIGTHLPKQKLHIVDGNILISKTSSKAPQSANGSILFGADITDSVTMGRWAIEYLNGEDDAYGLNFWRPWNPAGGGFGNYYLFLDDTGKVGMGTKTPQAKLDVVGSLKAQTAYFFKLGVGVANPVEDFQIGDIWTFHDGSTKYIGRNVTFSSQGSDVRIVDGNASRITFTESGKISIEAAGYGEQGSSVVTTGKNLTLDENGNVGIGTTLPQAKLDVIGSFKAQSATIHGTTSIKAGTYMLSIGNASSSNLNWGTAYIGFNATRDHANSNWTMTGDGAHNGGGTIWTTADGNIYFATVPSTNGNNQTLTDTQMKQNAKLLLSSDGILKAKQIKVTLADWSGFVFEKDYSLLSLPELEQYIKQHQRLPDIPSAQEVIENGIDLGDMQSKLLQKIEELTLYIFDLQKQIIELQQTKNE